MKGVLVFPDDVAAVDLLHAEPLARTIVEVMQAHPKHGLVLGIHGDWGAGKSTVLSLVERGLAKHDGVATLWFNGWEYEGFEDAKIAILEGIIRHLQQNKKFFEKAKDLFRRLRKRIDYMKLARAAVVGGAGVLAAGPVGLALMLPTLLDPSKVGKIFDSATDIIKDADGKDDPLDLRGFRRDFLAMLEKADITQLVVLVDDLDRCLPKTAIGTLEAIRLLISGERTVFVLACDRSMIEYAVREHFPEHPGMKGDEYARKYLDKLIQIPFVLPVLGPLEVGIYVQLLLLEGVFGSDDPGFIKVLEQARELSRKPWIDQQLDMAPIQDALSKDEMAKELHALMQGIAPVLATGTEGNPRQIKRFINAVFVRRRAAEARGLAEDVKIAPLMKLMLAEYFHRDLFDAIASESRDGEGNSNLVRQLESPPAQDTPAKKKGDKTEKPVERDELVRSDFANDPKIAKWAALDPKIAGLDLRPYLFVIRDARLVSASNVPVEVAELLDLIGQGKSLLAEKTKVRKLTPELRGLLASELATRLATATDASRQFASAKGIKDLINLDSSVAGIVDRAFVSLPISAVGNWISDLSQLAESGTNFRWWLQQVVEHGASRQLVSLIQALLTKRSN